MHKNISDKLLREIHLSTKTAQAQVLTEKQMLNVNISNLLQVEEWCELQIQFLNVVRVQGDILGDNCIMLTGRSS